MKAKPISGWVAIEARAVQESGMEPIIEMRIGGKTFYAGIWDMYSPDTPAKAIIRQERRVKERRRKRI
jgi:hypothetical protein